MRIFADQCVHIDLIIALREAGHKVKSTIEVKLEKASDEKIFSYTKNKSLVLLTFDHDFGNILRFDVKKSPGIVIVYIESLSKKAIVKRSLHFFSKFKEKDLKGRLMILDQSGKIRSWP